MAHLKPRAVFDPKQDLTTLKTFRAAGRRFTPGMNFNWRQLGLTQRRVQQMYEGSFLAMESSVSENANADDFDFDFGIAKPEAEEAPAESLEDHTVAELREIAANMGIEDLPRKKAEIIQTINAANV